MANPTNRKTQHKAHFGSRIRLNQIQIPDPVPTSCAGVLKLLNFLKPQFFNCKIMAFAHLLLWCLSEKNLYKDLSSEFDT